MFCGVARVYLMATSAFVSLVRLSDISSAQTPPPAESPQVQPGTVPTITVETTRKKPPAKKQVAKPAPRPVQPVQSAPPPETPRQAIAREVTTSDTERSNIYTHEGANSDTIGKEDIQRLPQGENAPVERVLLQLPGVTQD